MQQWQINKQKADSYRPEVERVIRQVAGAIIEFRDSTEDEDMHKATDYVVEISTGRIACRVRDAHYNKHFGDVTIRSFLASGARTELAKLRDGIARWYLYAWGQNGVFEHWVFWDIAKAVEAGVLDDRDTIYNKDGQSGFVAIPINVLRDTGCIVDESEANNA